MKGLASNDPELEADAVKKADIKLKELETEDSGFNKTFINKQAFTDNNPKVGIKLRDLNSLVCNSAVR